MSIDTKFADKTTLLKEKIALLDAITCTNIRILHINNFDFLIKEQILEVSNSPGKYVTSSGQIFTRLCVQDKLVNKLVAGSKIADSKKIDYCILEISIKSETGNLNCLSVVEYLDYLKIIQKHLEDTYGILTDFSAVALKKVEINKTFKLEDNFDDYHRVFQLMMANLPGYLSNQSDFKKNTKKGIEYGTYAATSATKRNSERCLTLKIYNKSNQLEKRGVILRNNYARVEITLFGTERIKKSLGTNHFHELTDEVINDFFDDQMRKMFVHSLKKGKEERDKYIVRLMKKQRKKDLQHWQVDVLRILSNEEIRQEKPIILDITDLMPLVEELNVKTKDKYNIRVRFRNQAKKYEDVFCNNDNARLQEVLTKLISKNDTNNVIQTDGIF